MKISIQKRTEKYRKYNVLVISFHLTIGTRNSPRTLEIAIEGVEFESPTIPITGGGPVQLRSEKDSSVPLARDKAARNAIPSITQLS